MICSTSRFQLFCRPALSCSYHYPLRPTEKLEPWGWTHHVIHWQSGLSRLHNAAATVTHGLISGFNCAGTVSPITRNCFKRPLFLSTWIRTAAIRRVFVTACWLCLNGDSCFFHEQTVECSVWRIVRRSRINTPLSVNHVPKNRFVHNIPVR